MRGGILGGRPVLRWLAAVLCVVGAAWSVSWKGRALWLAKPTVVLGQAQDFTIFGSAIIATYAAWLSGTARPMREWLHAAPRPRWEQDRVPLVLAAAAGMAAYWPVLLWMLLQGGGFGGGWSSLTRNPVGLVATVLVLGAAAVLWAGVGVAAGRWLPPITALICAPLLAYLSYYFLIVTSSTSPLGNLALGGNLAYVSVEPTTSSWCGKALFWVSVAALVTSAIASGRRWPVTVAAWATGLSAAGLILSGAPLKDTDTSPPVCDGTLPRVCVSSDNAIVLSVYAREVDRLWPLLPAALRTATVTDSVAVQQLSSQSKDILVAGPIDGVTEPASTIDTAEFAAYFGDRAVDRIVVSSCSGTTAPVDAILALKLWWRAEARVTTDASAYPGAPALTVVSEAVVERADALRHMTDGERTAWVQRQLVDACRPRP